MNRKDYDEEISLIFWVVVLCGFAYVMHNFYKNDADMQEEYEKSFEQLEQK